VKLLKKWRNNNRTDSDNDHGRGTALAKRERHQDDWGIERFRREMDRTFDRFWRDLERGDPWSAMSTLPGAFGGGAISNMTDWPAIDIAEDEKSVTLRVDLPGLEPKDIDVELSGNVLMLRGQRSDEWSENQRGVYRRERRSGSFLRTIPLPEYVERDKIDARYDKGTLTLTVPKAPGKGPKRVQVKA
jgi:HSP20 family protein